MARHPTTTVAPRPALPAGFALLVAVLGGLDLAGAPHALTAVVTASAALAVVAGVRLHRPERRLGWHLLAAGMAACAVPGLVGRPLLAVLYIAGEALLVAGLVVLVRGRGRPDRATVIDTAIIGVAFGSITWLYLVGPHASAAEVNGIAKAWADATAVMDLLLAVAASILLLGVLRQGAASRLLAAGLGGLIASHLLFLWSSMHGGHDADGLEALTWLVFCGGIGAAALHPSMRELQCGARGDQGLTPGRLAVFAVTSVLAPAVTILQAVLGDPGRVVLSVASGVIFLLVLLRVADLARVHGGMAEETLRTRFETRLGALVRNSSDVVSVVAPDGAQLYVSPAIESLVGPGSDGRDAVHPDDRAALGRFLTGLGPGESGAIDYRLRGPDGSWRDVESLATNLVEDPAVGGIVLNTRDVTDRKALERRLLHQASHDTLTGLPNRTLLRDRLELALARRLRSGAPLAVIFLDLDDFKNINDSLGHAAGDAVLQEVARRLDACIRGCDTATRLGGDEFAVLVDDLADESEAVAIAQRILGAIARPMTVGDRVIEPRGSLGIAFASDGREIADDLLRDADAAMYLAKDRGKGAYAIFEPAMHAAAVARVQLKADLARAIAQDAIALHYQPVVDLRTGYIPAYESLARWEHPERGQVSPGEFIPLAEETGLIVPLGRNLLRRACRQAAAFQAECREGDPLRVSVNVSARQLADDGLVADVRAAIEESGIRPCDLILELTESAMMSDLELAASRLEELRALGVGLAVDDFGTGYSSLNSIRRFPVDRLKIDRSFVTHLHDDRTRAVTGTIVELGLHLDMLVVAEGVEEPAQADAVLALGCPYAQGFLLARPAPAEDVLAHLAEHGRRVRLPVPATVARG